MSGFSYSKDQIEEKRLLALRRKAEKDSKSNNHGEGSNDTSRSPFAQNRPYQGNPTKSGDNQGAAGQYRPSRNMAHSKLNKSSPGPMRTPKWNNRPNPVEPQSFFGGKKLMTGTCAMITESRFIVEIEYNQRLLEVFKTIPSKLYDQKTRRWSFHLTDYDKLITDCMQIKSEVTIIGIPKYVLQIFKAMNKKLDEKVDIELTDLSSIDNKLMESLMPFQREGICYGISKGGRCFIADDMGLGKTIQALGLAHFYRENWPLLIVTPSSVRYQWSEAIFNFLPSVPTQYVHHFTSGKDLVGDSKITIVSYDLLVRSLEVFQRRTYGFVILDESHTVKSGKTARAKTVERIVAHARHVVLLSGTPALSRPIELYSQIKLVVPSFMGYHDYGVRYCAATKKAFGWDYSGSSNMEELNLLLRACCLIRRLKADVLKQLPAKIRQVVILDPTLIKKASKDAKLIAAKLSGKYLENSERKSAILKYYHESSDQRLAAVCNYVSDLVERGQKFLIFAHHQNVLEAISELLDSKKIRFIRIDGKTLPEQRKNRVDLFQESDDCLVAVLSITAANAGITLTAAQLVVFAELFWNPGVRAILCQAEDRVHRIGQANSVVIQYLVAKSTVDDHLWPIIQQKISVLTKVGLDQDFSLKKADVSQQTLYKETSPLPKQQQKTMDSFITISPNQTKNSPPTADHSENKSLEEFDHLLDLNDDDFADIDLDNFS